VAGRRWAPGGAVESQLLATIVLALAACGLLLTVMTRWAGPGGGRPLLPLLLACAPVVFLRRWPRPVLVVLTIAAGIVTVGGGASFPLGILLGLALYFSVLKLPRHKSIGLALAVAVVLGATMVYSAITVVNPPLGSEAVESFVPLAGAWFIADSVAARRRYQAGLAAQAERERAAEVREERLRIAREMHDVVAHALAVITVQAGVGRCLAGKRPEEASTALESIETIGRAAQDELRVVLELLRDGEDSTAPLAPAPRLVDVKELADTVRASGIAVQLRMDGTDRQLSPSLELSIYRVMQEALTNIVKHAPGARAVAELTVSAGKVRLDVRDDGGPGGCPVARTAPAAGHGIVGMRERIGAFGGWLAAGPVAGGGFQVTAEIPIDGTAS
jgi:signal transduction histidine kinase